jgi:ABC-2 type transport system permease protein
MTARDGEPAHGFARAFAASASREWRFLRRSPADLALAAWLPALCLVLLAWLLARGVVRDLPVAVVDDDRSAMSRELARLLDATPALSVSAHPRSLADAWPLVRARDVYAVVYVPAGASREVARGRSATVFTYYDATLLTAAQAARGDAGAAVQELAARLARRETARIRGVLAVRPSPVVVQASTPANAARSFEAYLLALLIPAVLHFALCLSAAGAFGRELRDATAGGWLRGSGGALFPAVAGKAAPYVGLSALQGVAGVLWLAVVRGHGVHGSVAMLLLGQGALYLASVAVALLFVGVTRNMGMALSLTTLYVGAALAYSGATFPIDGATPFAAVWNRLVPLTAYLKLQAAQLWSGAPWSASAGDLAALLLFALVPGALGLRLFSRAAHDPAAWGAR